MQAPFRIHGAYQTRVEGRLIITDVNGPWNLELVEAWAQQVHPLARALRDGGAHVGIAVISGSMLCPPDALARLRQVCEYGVRRQRCLAQMIVAAPEVEGRSLMAATFERMYDGLCPYLLLAELDLARQQAARWLAAAA